MNEKNILTDIVFEFPEKIEPPFSWVKHIPFAFFLIEAIKPEIFVELGVHTGNSFCAFCQAVDRLGLKTKCYGVDTWEGDELAGLYEERIYDKISGFVGEKYSDTATMLKMTFDDAVNRFDDSSIDLLHIDGLHTYEAVKHDFQTWLPKISNKGVIIMHDTSFKEGDFGVWKFWDEISSQYESINFEYGYGLGLVVIGKEISNTFNKKISEIKKNSLYQNIFRLLGEKIYIRESQEKKPLTKLYIDFGKGFSEEVTIFSDSGIEAGYINLTWDLHQFCTTDSSESDLKNIKGIRWDPLEKWCKVKLNEVSFQDDKGIVHPIEISAIRHNGKLDDDGWVVFKTFDPSYFFPVDLKPVSIKIKGKFELFCDPDIDECFYKKEQKIQEMDLHIKKIESELNNIKCSKLFRLFKTFKIANK